MSIRIHGVQFSSEEQMDCFTLALESLLRFYGLELACLHFDEWFFSCQRRDSGQLCIAAQTRGFAESLARFGVELVERQEKNFASGWSFLGAELKEGRPALVHLDTYYLRPYYYPGRPIHQPHALILTGCDPGEVFLVDPSPYTAFAGSIPLEGFERAWWGEGFAWCRLRVPAQVLSLEQEALAEGLRQNIGWMLAEEPLGIRGIRGLAESIEEAGEWKDERTLLGQCSQLKWVSLARQKHADFLAQAGKRLGEEGLVEVGKGLREVAHSWMVGRNLALKGCRRDTRAVAARLACRLMAIAGQEEQLLLRLARWLEAVGT